MRLTLRTLLAYLDDLLEPSETKEIGEKIKNSKEATDLIAHIQEVIRRRRLTSPDIDHPETGLDSNTVAEYLNNVLSPEQIIDVEKVFLESDVHLAEVAATQQIMTLVLSEPIEPSQESLERMYALVPPANKQTATESASIKNGQSLSSLAGESSERIDQAQATVTQPNSFEEGIPDYLKQTPLWRRLLPYGAAVGITLLWIALLIHGNPLLKHASDHIDSPPNGQLAQKQPQKSEVIPPVIPQKKDVSHQKEAPKEPAKQNPSKVNPKKTLVPVIAQIPISVLPVAPPRKQLMPATGLQYISNSGLLLRHDKKKDGWYVMPRRAMIHPGETIASPQPFASSIKVGDDLCQMTILGQTTLSSLPSTKTTSWGVSLLEGRLLIQAEQEKEAFPPEGIMLKLASHQDHWQLKLTAPKTVCGIEIILPQPMGTENKPSSTLYRAQLYVSSGSIQLTDSKGKTMNVASGFSIPLVKDFSVKVQPPENKKGAANNTPLLITLPEWLGFNKTTPSSTRRKYATLFEKEFDVDHSVALNVPPIVSNSRPKISELAVQCLALTRNVPAMVQALAQSEHEEARLAAMIGLRTWLGTTANTSLLLHKELGKYLNKEKSDAVYRLLWGYSPDDATDEATANQLILWLSSEHVAIRELAFIYVQQLSGRKFNYRPLGSYSQRNSSIRRWKGYIEKNEGLQQQEKN